MCRIDASRDLAIQLPQLTDVGPHGLTALVNDGLRCSFFLK